MSAPRLSPLRSGLGLLLALALAPWSALGAAETFPLRDVRLLDGPFKTAVDANRVYLLAHDVDRFVAPFRREAGLPPKAESYGDWETGGLDGHSAGHYLSALASMAASTGDAEMRRRLDYMVAELAACQQANGDGYVGGIPGSKTLWAEIAAGNLRATGFSLNDKWVPWYNLHKLFAGLRDAWLVGGNAQARDVLVRLTDWCAAVTAVLTDEQMQTMLRAEHGGMNEVLADVSVITGNKKYLTLARRFNHRAVLDPLAAREDKLTGLHANTQIPKVIGFQRIGTLDGDARETTAASFFWETVTGKRSVVFGGNSMAEHFNPTDDFQKLLAHREGPETCNTYNMLRLTEALFDAAPRAAYADYYERALYNHILASLNPAHPGYVYFTPIRPGHYRVYSQPGQHFWCCVGSGMENPGKYGEFIYAHDAGSLYVNLFLASELTWAERGLKLKQETTFPDEERTRLTLTLAKPATFALQIRHPAWVAGDALAISINGAPQRITSTPSSYLTLTREWRDGDRVEVALPMRTTTERLPDGSDFYALLHGPIVLAAATGTENLDGLRAGEGRRAHIPGGPLVPIEDLPVLLTTPEALPAAVRRAPGDALAFTLTAPHAPASAPAQALVPFFRLHDARYQLYWRVTTPERYAADRERRAAEERAAQALDAATLDSVRVGEQQPEVDHALRGEATQTGEHQGRRWRDARGWFSYDLRVPASDAATVATTGAELVVTYWGGDSGRNFDVTVNGTPLATERLAARTPADFYEKRYPLSPAQLAAASDGVLTVKFSAHKGSVAGVYGVRLMKSPAR